ncbi:titin-like [Bolinopsis microptera]|uniref:titin-like n=1 Tax=Bolinopsis microptera TaxID=2820187 RepID=UPI003078A83D
MACSGGRGAAGNLARTEGGPEHVVLNRVGGKGVGLLGSVAGVTSDFSLDGGDPSSENEAVICGEGQVASSDGTTCVACATGTYALEDSCVDCARGTYSDREGATECTPCGTGLSTINTASTSASLCIVICTVPTVFAGTPSPQSGTFVAQNGAVVVNCNTGYSSNNQNIVSYECEKIVSCSKVEATTQYTQIVKGYDATITCEVSSEYTPSNCVWNKDGNVVVSGGTFTSSNNVHTCTYSLASFSTSNEGVYTCSASINSVTTPSTSISLFLLESVFNTSPVYVIGGSQIILTCGADAPSQLNYLPTIAWADDEGNTGYSEFVTYSTSNNIRYSYLTLTPTALVDSYICTVSYSDFSDNLLVSSVSVSTITMYDAPESKTIVTGRSVTLTCVASSAQQATITWSTTLDSDISGAAVSFNSVSKHTTSTLTIGSVNSDTPYTCTALYNGVKVTGVASITVQCDPTGTSKFIQMTVQTSSEGGFYCKATYADNTVISSANAYLLVYGIKTSPGTVVGVLDNEATLTCVISGPVPSTVQWYHESSEVSDSSKHTKRVEIVEALDSLMVVGQSFVGGTTTLTCKIYAGEQPNLVNFLREKDLVNVVSTDTFDLESGLTTSTLVLENLQESDFTLYSSFITLPETTTQVNANTEVKVTCSINYSNSPPTIVWYKGADLATQSATQSNDDDNLVSTSTLVFSSVVFADEGQYKCQATYSGLTGNLQSTEFELFVRGVFTNPRDLNAVKDNDAKLTCVYKNEVQTAVTWYKNNVALTAGGSTVNENQNTLTFSNFLTTSVLSLSQVTASDDQAQLFCRATLGGVTVDSSTVTMTVYQPTALPSISVELGSSISLAGSAPVSTGETITINWFKSFTQVTDNIVTTTVGNLYQSTMTVPVIAFGDAGNYFYEVTYGASDNFLGGSLETEYTQVTVYGFSVNPVSTLGIVDKSMTLTCVARADSQPSSLSWLKDDQLYTTSVTSPSYDSETKKTTSTAVFSSVQVNDAGSYKCRAIWSDVETYYSTVSTITTSSLGLIQHPADVYVTAAGTVTFTCKTSTSSQLSQISWITEKIPLSSNSPVTTTASVGSGGEDRTHTFTYTSTSSVENLQVYCQIDYQTGESFTSDKADLFYRGFMTEPEAVAVRTGEGLTLTCVVSGDEPDSITWFKDDALVVSASAVFEIQSNYDPLTFTKQSLLVVEYVTSFSKGSYVCKAKFSDNSEKETDPVLVQPIEVSLSDIYYTSNAATVTLTCVLSSKPSTNSATFTYLDSGGSSTTIETTTLSEISSSEYQATTTYSVSLLTGKTFLCQADFSSIGAGVLKADAKSPNLLQVLTQPVTSIGFSGDALTLTCGASYYSSLPTTFTWINAAGTTFSAGTTSGITVTNTNGASTLTIGSLSYNTVTNTQDQYQCSVAYTGVGTLQSNFADVYVREIINYSTVTNNEFAGAAFTLSCSYMSNQAVTVSWKQGNDVITTGTTTHLGNGKNLGTLVFASLTVADAGDYKCTATEDSREVLSSGTVTLTVLALKSEK